MSQQIDTNTKLRVRLEQVMRELSALSAEVSNLPNRKTIDRFESNPKYGLNRAHQECGGVLLDLEERSAK